MAELTGRKGRMVRTKTGARYESRGEDDVALDKLNLKEKERFMTGEKLIAIISEAASVNHIRLFSICSFDYSFHLSISIHVIIQ